MTPTLQHVSVGVVSDGEQMRWHFSPLLAVVFLDNVVGVDGQPSVGIDGHTEQAGVGLEHRTAILAHWTR